MLANKYLNLGYVSMIAIILGLAITTSYVNTAQADGKEKVELQIKGMGCPMCTNAIEKIVSDCAGVMDCKVSYKEGKATVRIETGKAVGEQVGIIKEALEEGGFVVDDWDIEEMYQSL